MRLNNKQLSNCIPQRENRHDTGTHKAMQKTIYAAALSLIVICATIIILYNNIIKAPNQLTGCPPNISNVVNNTENNHTQPL